MPPPSPAVAVPSALERALACSRYLRRLLESRPQLREEVAATLHAPFGAERHRAFLSRQPLTDDTLKSGLRRLRARVFAHVATRDLARSGGPGGSDGNHDPARRTAVDHRARPAADDALVARHGEPGSAEGGKAQELIVVGMGKLGGRELNVSSDIDLIFVYPEDGDTAGAAQHHRNFEFFTRLGGA